MLELFQPENWEHELTLHWIFWNPGGVKNVRAKLQPQLKNVARDTALLRMYSGMISGG